jgi:hypothetical protein
MALKNKTHDIDKASPAPGSRIPWAATTTQPERNAIKNAVLGANGGLLAAWIARAALAYTDSTGAATDHFDVLGCGNVISSTAGFTPLAGPGAIYEFREREIDMAAGNTAEVILALTRALNAA